MVVGDGIVLRETKKKRLAAGEFRNQKRAVAATLLLNLNLEFIHDVIIDMAEKKQQIKLSTYSTRIRKKYT